VDGLQVARSYVSSNGLLVLAFGADPEEDKSKYLELQIFETWLKQSRGWTEQISIDLAIIYKQ
jgi:hypothetical protein